MDEISMQQEQALDIARMLVKAGVPMFLAHPNPEKRTGWDLPFGWETNEPDVSVVDAWRPGMALCAVTGHTFDLVDVDPRSGGSEADLGAAMPHSYLTAETPSGGRHHFVKTLGVPSLDGKVAAGIDVKSGTMAGEGRGFAFIAPTVRASKVDGVPREYRWVVGPKGPMLPSPDQLAQDGSGGLLRARVLEIRRTAASETPRRVSMSQARREWDAAVSGLTDSVRRWMRVGWGGEAHSTILAVTTRLARLSPETAEQGFMEAFEAAGAVPDADDLAKLHSAIEKAVPDVVVPDSELSAAELFFSGGGAAPSPGGSLPAGLLNAAVTVDAGALLSTSSPGEVGRRRFQPMNRDAAEAIVPPEPLIDGWLLRGTKARLSGPSGAGKTWLALDLAAHIASGKAWRGASTEQGRVLYVAAEGAPSFSLRMQAWDAAYGVRAPVDLVPDAPQLMDDTWIELIHEMTAAGGYALVIFDTQGAITVGMEENSNKDAQTAQARLSALINVTGAAVLLIHHTGWENGDRARGASGMYGGMDTELVLSQRDGNKKELTLKNPKQRHIEEHKDIRLSLVRSADGLAIAPASKEERAGDFFSPNRVAELWGLVRALEAYDGAQPHHGVRHLRTLLREGGHQAPNKDLEEVVRVFKIRAGAQGLVAPAWYGIPEPQIEGEA